MTIATFPALPGLGWSVHKKPSFGTLVANHVSGREVRDALYQNPIWRFELTFDGLAADAATYPGLGPQSLQALMGLFLQSQGQFATFAFLDPTDYAVAGQRFATGDGTTTSFQLNRNLGGFVEPIIAPFLPTALTPIPFPNGVVAYPDMNLFANSVGSNSGLVASAVTLAGGQGDPNGGTLATLVAETTANAAHFASQSAIPVPAGGSLTFSIYLKKGGSQFCQVFIDNGSANGAYANFDLINALATASGAVGSGAAPSVTLTAAGNGFLRASVSTVLDAVSTSARAGVAGVNANPTSGRLPSYAGATANTFTAAFPQLQVQTALAAPGAFLPTLTSLNYGQPSVTVAGAYVDPSSYTINPMSGAIVFSAAPAASAALAWTGLFSFLCRFDDDSVDFEQFMQTLWGVKSLKLRSVRGS